MCGNPSVPLSLDDAQSVQRVVNGRKTEPHSHPWIGSVQNCDSDFFSKDCHSCAAILISADTLITTFHCGSQPWVKFRVTVCVINWEAHQTRILQSSNWDIFSWLLLHLIIWISLGDSFPMEELHSIRTFCSLCSSSRRSTNFWFGAYDMDAAYENTRQRRKASYVYNHWGYGMPWGWENDLAIVRLAEPVRIHFCACRMKGNVVCPAFWKPLLFVRLQKTSSHYCLISLHSLSSTNGWCQFVCQSKEKNVNLDKRELWLVGVILKVRTTNFLSCWGYPSDADQVI